MKLHTHPEEFRELITVVANEKHISESAVERDYYIVMMLKSLADSPYADQCVFKGGTSLSKCYPGSIDRFSEDIDLTFLGMELSDKACDKTIKKIETIMAAGAQTEKIVEERSNRSKSMYVWFGNPENRVKLEIGSTVRPDPYQKMPVKTCIQEFLESRGFTDDIERFELETVEINTLNIERTFIDKIMSVKRHAICGTLNRKVRHIYDVTRLYQMPEIQAFLAETDELKRLVRLTKDTDSYYIAKLYRKESDVLQGYCQSHAASVFFKDRFIGISTPISDWRIIPSGKGNEVVLYHKNTLGDKKTGPVPRYHLQWVSQNTISGYLEYISDHDLYRNMHPLYPVQSKKNSPPPMKGTKRYRKEQKRAAKKARRQSIAHVLTLIENLDTQARVARSM